MSRMVFTLSSRSSELVPTLRWNCQPVLLGSENYLPTELKKAKRLLIIIGFLLSTNIVLINKMLSTQIR